MDVSERVCRRGVYSHNHTGLAHRVGGLRARPGLPQPAAPSSSEQLSVLTGWLVICLGPVPLQEPQEAVLQPSEPLLSLLKLPDQPHRLLPVQGHRLGLEAGPWDLAQIVPGWTVQPDLQYIWHPSGVAGRDAKVVGIRTMLKY